MLLKVALFLFILIALGYVLLLTVLFLSQEKMIFPGFQTNPLWYKNLQHLSADIQTNTDKLQGWALEGESPSSELVAIYFGGNGEDVSGIQSAFKGLAVTTTYTYNYRGYGESTGQASEQAIYSDALAIYDSVTVKHPNKKVVIIGRSLGSAVAGYVSVNRDANKLILLTPPSSIPEVAQSHFNYIFPQCLVKHKFNLVKYANQTTAPTLVILAQNDLVIPKVLSMKTHKAINADKELVEIPNAGHNDLFTHPETLQHMNKFII